MQQLRLFPCIIPYPDCVYSLSEAYAVIEVHQDHFCQGEFLVIVDESEVEHDRNPKEEYDDEEDDEFESKDLSDKKCYKEKCERTPIDSFYCHRCGGIAWCDWHNLSYRHSDLCDELHGDISCLPSCCDNGHIGINTNMREIERRAGRHIIVKRELSQPCQIFGKKIFLVTLAEKGFEKFVEDVIYVAGYFVVKELEKIENDEKCFPSKRHMLYPGTRAVIAPGIFSYTSLAVRLYYYGKPLEVVVLTYKSKNGCYTCLLPKGVIIPDYSFPYQDNYHAINLDRSNLVVSEDFFVH